MDYEKENELRNKYDLIMRGFLTLRNSLEFVLNSKATGVPFLDENDEHRKKVLDFIERAASKARQFELEALMAEYGPDAAHVLG